MNLKPMDIGEILDQTFSTYKNNFKTYLAISAINLAPALIIFLLFLAAGFLLSDNEDVFLIATILITVVGVVGMILISLAAYGGSIKVVSEQVLDRKLGFKEALSFGYKKKWPIFAGGFLYVLAFMVGSILFIIPGILFYVWFMLYAQAVVIEDLGPMKALSRSKALIKGSWWRSFGIVIVMTILTGFLGNIITLPLKFTLPVIFSDEIAAVLNFILTIGMSMLLTPITYIATTLLYYDLRIRKEGYDIQVMTENLQQVPETTVQE